MNCSACCSVLQCVAVCCSVLQPRAPMRQCASVNVAPKSARYYICMYVYIYVYVSTHTCVAVRCSVLQCVAGYVNRGH